MYSFERVIQNWLILQSNSHKLPVCKRFAVSLTQFMGQNNLVIFLLLITPLEGFLSSGKLLEYVVYFVISYLRWVRLYLLTNKNTSMREQGFTLILQF